MFKLLPSQLAPLTLGAGFLFGQTLELDETVVVASRIEEKASEVTGSTTTVTAAEMLELGATSLSDTLKYEPGVSIPFDLAGVDGLVPYLAGGDSAVNIRGLEGNRISINIDGIRQPEDFTAKSFEGAGGPGRIYFDPATFSQIELYKSAASSLYGSDAIGGVVSGRTESALTLLGPSLDGRVLNETLTFTSVNQGLHNRIAQAFGNGTTAASVVYSYRKGQERENNGNIPANPSDLESHAFVTTLNWRPSPTTLLTATADYYHSESFMDVNSAEGDTGQGIFNTLVTSEDTRERLRFSLDFEHQPDVPLTLYDHLSSKLYWQDATTATDNVQQGFDFSFRDWLNDLDYQTTITGLSLQASKSLANHTLTYGAEGSYSLVEASFFRTQTFPDGSNIVQDLIGMAPSDVIRSGIFLSDKITFANERLSITPALRADYYSVEPENTESFLNQSQNQKAADYENVSLSPSVSFLLKFTGNTSAFGSWSQGTRNPSAEELNGVFSHGSDFIVVPNPDLKEERSNSFELGLRHQTDTFNASLAGYYNLYSDFFESNIPTGETIGTQQVLQTQNRTNAEIYGIELKTDWLIGEQLSFLEGLSLGGSFSWTEGTYDNNDEGEAPLNSIDPWKAVSYLAYNSPESTFGSRLTATYVAAKDDSDIDYSSDTSFLPADSWFTLDLTGYYQLTDDVRLRAGISNLLDEQYINWATARRGRGHGSTDLNDSFFTQPGRSFFVACDISF